jgi:hypothetical protein
VLGRPSSLRSHWLFVKCCAVVQLPPSAAVTISSSEILNWGGGEGGGTSIGPSRLARTGHVQYVLVFRRFRTLFVYGFFAH